MEYVFGPLRGGYYIAAYACPDAVSPAPAFMGYFKVFVTPVQGYFDSGVCILKGCCEAPEADARLAVQAAMERARHQTMNLRPARELRFVRERRQPFGWELRQGRA